VGNSFFRWKVLSWLFPWVFFWTLMSHLIESQLPLHEILTSFLRSIITSFNRMSVFKCLCFWGSSIWKTAKKWVTSLFSSNDFCCNDCYRVQKFYVRYHRILNSMLHKVIIAWMNPENEMMQTFFFLYICKRYRESLHLQKYQLKARSRV
jgi:hypothetical protein